MDRDTDESVEGTAPGTGRAYQTLRHRDFRLLWSAELASTLGSQMQRVAIAYQVFRITGDPLQLGLLELFRFAPIALFGRGYAAGYGLSLLLFHATVHRVMKLHFLYNEYLIWIYLVNVPFWILLAARSLSGMRSRTQ